MTTDSYYAIGKSHLVCQDVARHGDGETPFIIVCDGCSGSPQTELGAQILAQTIATEYAKWDRWVDFWRDQPIQARIRQIANAALWEAVSAVDRLHLHRLALDATLMLAHRTVHDIVVAVWGDGAIMWRLKSGKRLLRTIEFKHSAPAYLNYQVDPARAAGYTQKTEDALRTISTYEDRGDGFGLIDSFDDTGMDPWSLGFSTDAVDLVLLASDGLGSFQRRVDSHFEAVPINEVADKAFGFKGMAGSFVARRMRRFLTVEAPALGWHHDDDLSVAAIHV